MKLFLIAFSLMFINCNSQDSDNVIVTINNSNNYYFKKDTLISIASSENDSVSFKYKDTLLLKVEKYETGKLISEANIIYNSDNSLSDDYLFSEDYYDYYVKFYTRTSIPYKNKYRLLDSDFYYIGVVLDEVKDWKKYCNNKTEIKSFEFKLDENVGMVNARCSPFLSGSILKNLKLYVSNDFLVEMDAVLIEEDEKLTEKTYYKKYYQYDKAGRLSSTKTINVTSGEIEDQDKVTYREWLVYP